MEDEQEGREPTTKKLGFSEPDLCVIVGGQEGSAKEEYYCHAAVLATQSSYIDAMLASPMKEGSEYVLTFPDLDPETWQDMMMFLMPNAANLMQLEQAEKLAPFNDDKYGTISCTAGIVGTMC